MLAQIYCSKVHIGVSVRHLSLGYIYIYAVGMILHIGHEKLITE